MVAGKQVLVTTGATVTFSRLIEHVLDLKFLKCIKNHGYTLMVIQYGRSENSVEVLHDNIRKFYENSNFQTEEKFEKETGNTVTFFYDDKNIQIRCIQFDSKLVENYVEKSDMVISHAGTGSIMDTLRNGKIGCKLIVMINDSLQDNHQEDIAQAFESLNVLKSVHSNDIGELIEAVDDIEDISKAGSIGKLGKPNGEAIERIVINELMQ